MSALMIAVSVILLLATVGTLFAGILSMGRGGEYDERNSTRLMSSRVGLQAAAVAVLVLLLVVSSR